MEPFDNRGSFEQAFSLAFDGAEIAPDAHVWDKLDAGLAKDQSSSYKKRLFVFQLVAAASLIFAASITLFQAFNNDDIATSSRQVLTEQSGDAVEKNEPSQTLESQPLVETPRTAEESKNALATVEQNPVKQNYEPNQLIPFVTETHDEQDQTIIDPDDSEIRVALEKTGKKADPNSKSEWIFIEPADYMVLTGLSPYEPQFIPIWVKLEEKDSKTDLWASAGFAAGSYNPSSGMGFSFGAADEAAFASPQTDQSQDGPIIFSDEQSGRTLGGGVGLGGRIGRKWVLESGLNYVHSEINGTTNSFIESDGKNYPVYYETSFAGSLQNTGNFNVTTTYDFIAVPFKAGYVLVDKKVGWVATGGIGSNILVGNSLNSELGQFEQINYSISDSPYRRMSWSGIIGTEVYFNLTEDYQLMIVPQYNFGITEITKQESSFSIVPNSFNLGIRFRYLLK